MQEVITKPTDQWTDGPALGPSPTQTSCDHLSKDTVVKAFQPQPGQDPPSVTHTPHIHLGQLSLKEGKYYSFMCLKSQEDLCFDTKKKDHLGFASLLEEEAQQRGTPGPPLGTIFPCTLGGTVGNSATYSWHLASQHLGATTNPQLFLRPCYVSSTVLSICVITNAHSQLVCNRWVLMSSPTLQMRKLKFKGITRHV